METCSICGKELHDEWVAGINGQKYCEDCVREHNIEFCSHPGCSKALKPEELFISRNGFLCKKHFLENYFICPECNTQHMKQYGYKVRDSSGLLQYVCHSCFKESFFKCESCGNIHPKGNVKKLIYEGKELSLCDNCYTSVYPECHHCKEKVHIDKIVEIRGRGFSFVGCRDCAEKEFKKCNRCGEWYKKDYKMIERDGNKYCESCWYNRCIIQSYNYKPTILPKKLQSETTDLLFGIENEIELNRVKSGSSRIIEGSIRNYEVEYKHWVAAEIDKFIPGFLYQKNDGSLSYGIEIVSHPATIEFWESIGDKLEDMFKFLRTEECQGENASTAGMHVHCSRKEMNRMHQNCFSAFIYGNKDVVTKIAGRDSNGYSKYKNIDKSNIDKTIRIVSNHDERYTAVNWKNKNTVEVRIFQSTLNVEQFLSNLEFCNGIYMFTKERNIAEIISDDCFKNFCEFIDGNNYKYLPNLIKKKNIWPL